LHRLISAGCQHFCLVCFGSSTSSSRGLQKAGKTAGGWGILADDLAAGLWAAGVWIAGEHWLTGMVCRRKKQR
jgi:hypothetical protein